MIINKTKKKTISEKYSLCTSLLSKTRGLMFSKKKNLVFVFDSEKKISLHMLFVFFPIWVIYINRNMEVVFTKKLYPFISFCEPNVKASYVIELIAKPDVKIGDNIVWKSSK
jgi:uncharacterized protein